MSYGKVGIAFGGMSVGFFGYGIASSEPQLITVPLRDIPITTELLASRSFLITFSLLLIFLSANWFKIGSVQKSFIVTVLSNIKPLSDAIPEKPQLEDAYLCLLHNII
ncbi:MAG: hypothetical protein ACUVRP_00955 [Chlorobiales bacterium]